MPSASTAIVFRTYKPTKPLLKNVSMLTIMVDFGISPSFIIVARCVDLSCTPWKRTFIKLKYLSELSHYHNEGRYFL